MSDRHAAAIAPLRITQNFRLRALAVLCIGVGPWLAFAADATATEAAASAEVAAAPAAAKPEADTPFDLGDGLGYLRVRRVADTLSVVERAMVSGKALVLDLRYTAVAESDVPAFSLTLAQRAPATPLFVLVSPQTPAALTPVLTKLAPPALILGVAGSLPAPTIVVAQPADVDRRAYDALDGGMPLEALITGKIEKERFDEAELVKEFENGNANAAPPPEPDPTKPAAEKAPVLTDRVLQRAVHLHRALSALKRD